MPNPRLDALFARWREEGLAVTFDDVRLEASFVNFRPDEINLRSRITRNVEVLSPIVSAAMDTVTGPEMAIALAKAGGIGSIHRGMSIEAQVKAVAQVKHHIHGLIRDPITASDSETVASFVEKRKNKGWKFDSFPVVDKGGQLVGLMTHSDFKWCERPDALIRDVMTPFQDLTLETKIVPKEEAYRKLNGIKKNILIIVDEGTRHIIGMYVASDLIRIISEKPNHNVDGDNRLRVAAAIGADETTMERAEALAEKGVDVFHIDTAHAHTAWTLQMGRELKRKFPEQDLLMGNISRGIAAEALADAGADGILVGQGGGSICTTRPTTGIGKPQVSAVYECLKAVEGRNLPVCADGAIKQSGDIVVALALGASTVMVGGLLAGTDEAPGEKKLHQGRLVKMYRGMGSLGALRENASSRQRYQQGAGALVPEGVEGIVPYKGPVQAVLEQALGGLRKGMWYTGARSLPDLWNSADMFRITQAGVVESHPHDLLAYEDAPNYQGRHR